MELYLKQNKFSFNTKLFFYDKQENLCFQTNSGLHKATSGIEILNNNQDKIVNLKQKTTLLQRIYTITLTNGGHIEIKSPKLAPLQFKATDSIFSLEKTKRKTILLKMAHYPIMEYVIKKGKDANYAKLVIFDEKYTHIALSFVTTICCIASETKTVLPLRASSFL